MTADILAVPESIPVTDALTLIAIDERYVSDLHQLVVKNQRWLQQSLSWPAEVRSEDETRRHVQGNVMLHQRDYAKMFLLFLDKQLVGSCRSIRSSRRIKRPILATGSMKSTRGKGCFPVHYRPLSAIMPPAGWCAGL